PGPAARRHGRCPRQPESPGVRAALPAPGAAGPEHPRLELVHALPAAGPALSRTTRPHLPGARLVAHRLGAQPGRAVADAANGPGVPAAAAVHHGRLARAPAAAGPGRRAAARGARRDQAPVRPLARAAVPQRPALRSALVAG